MPSTALGRWCGSAAYYQVLVTGTGMSERERRVLYCLSKGREKEVLDLVATLLDLVPHVTLTQATFTP
jgi:hypothetical protein